MPDPALEHRPLGTTGLLVPPLCIGCAPLGDMVETFTYSVGKDQALATVRAALDGPLSFLDTAASYGDGESERRIGLVLRERGGVPPGAVVATKADRDLHMGEYTGDQMRRSVERSMRLLGVDHLQLCYLHDPEHIGFAAAMAPGGPVAALERLHEEGVIDHLGVAGGPIDMMIQFIDTDLFEAAISHNRFTLLNQEADPSGTRASTIVSRHSTRRPMGRASWRKGRVPFRATCTAQHRRRCCSEPILWRRCASAIRCHWQLRHCNSRYVMRASFRRLSASASLSD